MHAHAMKLVVAAALALTAATPAHAQDPIVKPTTTSTSIARLPAPAKITAAQQADGRIRVVWSSVDGAARYALYRSVPNYSQGYVTLQSPTDTTFVDADVKKGLYYYYVIQAIDVGGGGGMKISAPPVIASTTVTTTTTTTTTSTRVIEAPTGVAASILSYPSAMASFRSSQTGVQFRVERGVVTGAGTTFTPLSSFLSRCCSATDRDVATAFPVGTRLVYRVTAVDSATPTLASAPVLSNELVTYQYVGTTGPSYQLLVQAPTDTTSSLALFAVGAPQSAWTNKRIVTLDPTIVEVRQNYGGIVARAVGTAYVVISGTRADGVVESRVHRIDVVPRP